MLTAESKKSSLEVPTFNGAIDIVAAGKTTKPFSVLFFENAI